MTPSALASAHNYNVFTLQDDKGKNKKKTTADYDTFLKLLVTQMKNQDPTKPADATQYVSQLATFSSLEQEQNINKRLDETNKKLERILSESYIGQAGNYIGKHVTSAEGSVSGIIKSVKIYADGLLAVLENGEEVIIQPGVIVHNNSSKEEKNGASNQV